VEGEIGPGAGTVEEEFDHGVSLLVPYFSSRCHCCACSLIR
jgi:hypothetical protein